MGSPIHYFALGDKIPPALWIPMYLVPFVLLYCSPAPIAAFLQWHGLCQLLLFVVVVQVPTLVFGKMSYVDLGWPLGLVLLGACCLLFGEGYWLRRWLVGGAMLLHGLRMGVGAILMFGYSTKWTFVIKEDLPRYQYAKVRWEREHGMPPHHWWIKMQHDTLQQCYANAIVLACPVVLCCFDETPTMDTLTLCGVVIWAISWVWENCADIQKNKFLAHCKAAAKALDPKDVKGKERLRHACLGYSPYDGPEYWLWAKCRHPNYFGEWSCWVGFVVASLPSLLRLPAPAWVTLSFAFTNVVLLIFFYDCLLNWTGAAPAEHFSTLKRPNYRHYQEKVRCLFPMEVPEWLVCHHRVAGWPDAG